MADVAAGSAGTAMKTIVLAMRDDISREQAAQFKAEAEKALGHRVLVISGCHQVTVIEDDDGR